MDFGECSRGRRVVAAAGFVTASVQGRGGAVTRVGLEQIDSRPLSTASGHAASIIIRGQERFEASWSSRRGPAEQAADHVTPLPQLATRKQKGRAAALMKTDDPQIKDVSH